MPELSKTRSGKIMRRRLRHVAEGRELGDTSTLVDPSVFGAIRAYPAFPVEPTSVEPWQPDIFPYTTSSQRSLWIRPS